MVVVVGDVWVGEHRGVAVQGDVATSALHAVQERGLKGVCHTV